MIAPPATTRHVEDRLELAGEATTRGLRPFERYALRDGNRAGVRQRPRGLARGLADFVVQGPTEHREQLVAEYQFLNASVRRDGLQRASAAWLQSLSAHLEERLTAFSSPSPKTDASPSSRSTT